MERAISRTCAHFNQNACDGKARTVLDPGLTLHAKQVAFLSDSSRNDLLWSQHGPRHEETFFEYKARQQRTSPRPVKVLCRQH